MFGVNGSATPDGSLLQLRAFDWIVDGDHDTNNHARYAKTIDGLLFLQVPSRTILKSQCTIPALTTGTPLPTLAGLVGSDLLQVHTDICVY